MLRQVLRTFEEAQGPLRLADVARDLNIDQGALEGMIAYWVRKGRLKEENGSIGACSGGTCANGCAQATGCPFAGKMPRTISLVTPARASSASSSEPEAVGCCSRRS